MNVSKRLKSQLIYTFIAVLIALGTIVSATYAWYIYQTNAKTTDVHMAVGTGVSLQISNEYDGDYGSAVVMEAFAGLLNPVSTNRITGGFQKVYGYTNGSENQPTLVANLFGKSGASDYYKTSLFLRTSGKEQKIYLADIGYEDEEAENPISTAIRIGLVVHEPGRETPVSNEYIFAINTERNPKAEYNTATGKEGYVLDCTRTDGTTIPMERLFTAANYCNHNEVTGSVSLKEDSIALFELAGNEQGGYGEPVQVDVYIWLEGCDEDCTNNLCSAVLKKIALSFACSAE